MIRQDRGSKHREKAELGVSQADRLVFALWHGTRNMTPANVAVSASCMKELPQSATARSPHPYNVIFPYFKSCGSEQRLLFIHLQGITIPTASHGTIPIVLEKS